MFCLGDNESHDLIQHFLLHINTDIHTAYKKHYLYNPNSSNTLLAVADLGKPQTLVLLLSLGLTSCINSPDKTKSPPWTPLDQALHSAELSRCAHMKGLASCKLGAARAKALEQSLVYGEYQGSPVRAAEAYRAYPQVIKVLREAGAKRKCELEGNTNGDYIEQPGGWDKIEIQGYGFTPETQPNLENWKDSYGLARYSSGRWCWLGMLKGGKKHKQGFEKSTLLWH